MVEQKLLIAKSFHAAVADDLNVLRDPQAHLIQGPADLLGQEIRRAEAG